MSYGTDVRMLRPHGGCTRTGYIPTTKEMNRIQLKRRSFASLFITDNRKTLIDLYFANHSDTNHRRNRLIVCMYLDGQSKE